MDTYFFADKAHIQKEKDKARELRKSHWWKQQLQKGICHYCQKVFDPQELTMDHIIPVSRGGRSIKGNVVPACRECNKNKGCDTPVDQILKELKEQGEL